MSGTIQLTVTRGELQGRKFSFSDRTLCTVGRSHDCLLRLADDTHRVISRHHCVFDINPPHVRLRDCGSRNGTWLNGENIGQRPLDLSPEAASGLEIPSYELADGDEIRVGNTCFRVAIAVPATCIACGHDVPEEERTEAVPTADGLVCAGCRQKGAAVPGVNDEAWCASL